MRTQLLLLAAASASALAVSTANAQTTDDQTAVEEVVVTGTRTAGRSRLDTVSPVDVVDSKALTRQGSTELAQALSTLAPSLNFPRPSAVDGTDSVRPATLRGLAPDQTLVLLNGKRGHAAALVNVNGSVGRGSAAFDLNTIPTVALDRVEILREGAAAQYGSDAIAGVVNLRLREARSGGGATASYGLYNTEVKTARDTDGRKATDGVTYTASVWQGFGIGEDGYLTVTADWSKRNPTNRSDVSSAFSPGVVTGRYGDAEVESKSLFANAGLPIGETWKAYGWLGYQHRDGESAAFPRLSNNAANIPSIYPNGFLPKIATDIDDYNAAFGAKGQAGDYTIDASFTYGQNDIEYGVKDSLNASYGPASPTSFNAGSMRYRQAVASLDITRPLAIAAFAQPSTLAFGAEYRKESYDIVAGEQASWANGGYNGLAAGAQGFPGFRPSNAVDVSRDNYSFYVDLDSQVTDKLDVDIAARFEDYSDFGTTTTGKVAARYDILDGFAVRGAVSTGFRAPALQQQYFTATSTNIISGTATEVGTFPATSPVSAVLGAKALEPEESTNYSLGLVYHRGPFEVTVDAYQIDIDNRIVLSENIQGSATGTATQQAIYALLAPYGVTTARFFINGVDTTTKGVDVVVRYRLDAAEAGRFDLTLAGNYNETEVTRLPTTNTLSSLPVPPALFARVNVQTFERGTPRTKFVASGDWSKGPWGATLKLTGYGTVLQPNATPSLDYWTGRKAVIDLEARRTFADKLTWAVGANNLFDEYPNRTPAAVNSTSGVVGFPNYSPFGFNGRFLYTRLSYNW
ncbi:TonB-dependent receptor plug domain-containing protein [Caulobacter radicis]|uniref:TonB-dependent receptor n=1 Tax=Caulobacter radicis TaxID=2172650 RepID=A0A2T9JW72_9CAUL|nr:TonB-dependent receptor [Caulobacter radicis]PVM87934.1 TonB-dependent receptor [Caulobacter radicis]